MVQIASIIDKARKNLFFYNSFVTSIADNAINICEETVCLQEIKEKPK